MLDLQEAGRVHDHELLAGLHGQPARVAEGQDLLEAGGRHHVRQLEGALAVAAEQVTEVEAAGGQDGPMGLEGLALDHNGHIAVEAQQTLLAEAAEHGVPEVGDLDVQHLRHGRRGWRVDLRLSVRERPSGAHLRAPAWSGLQQEVLWRPSAPAHMDFFSLLFLGPL